MAADLDSPASVKCGVSLSFLLKIIFCHAFWNIYQKQRKVPPKYVTDNGLRKKKGLLIVRKVLL